MVEKVEAYKSKDGAIFKDEESAKKHEKQKGFEDDIDYWFNRSAYFDFDTEDIHMSILLKEAIMDDHSELRKILEKYKNYK